MKTLYRHLKQEHGISGCPCHICGKTFTRAQSMLFHVNNKHQEFLVQPKSEETNDDHTSTSATVSLSVQYDGDQDQAKQTSVSIESLDLSLFLGQENQQIPVEDHTSTSATVSLPVQYYGDEDQAKLNSVSIEVFPSLENSQKGFNKPSFFGFGKG